MKKYTDDTALKKLLGNVMAESFFGVSIVGESIVEEPFFGESQPS
jgi:hypothetical protein